MSHFRIKINENKSRLKKFSQFITLLALSSLIFSLIFLLSACGGYNPQPKEVNYFQGIKGLEMNFWDNSPPEEIYEESTFTTSLLIENRGAFDVLEDRHGVLSIGFDPFYIDSSGIQGSDRIVVSSNSLIVKGIQLPGKSQYYPTGMQTFLSIPGFKIRKIIGQREKPTTQLSASLCYPYTTTFSGLVCVDLSTAGENLRKQICYQQDLSLSDQGAPVAVSSIEVENQPVGQSVVRPVYVIHIKNKGSGTVLSPTYNPAELERVCSFQDLNRQDFNTIQIEAYLSDSKQLICNPNPVRLVEGEGFARCQVGEEDLVLGHQNYEAPLSIKLDYVYITSLSKELGIKRINSYGGSSEAPPKCLPYEVEEGGRCIVKCDYCSQNKGAGDCQPASSTTHINFEEGGFACQCSSCTDRTAGSCVAYSNYCPGAIYCCQPKCSGSEILVNGKCYSKCSKCSSSSSALSKDCACGSGSSPSDYVVALKGKFCCPDKKEVRDTAVDCVSVCSEQTAPSQNQEE
ncbi:hypothetical protein JW756_01785 [Candidatus Woesearchaeota archaeon]|nr:hypothetical protein [Candidatus Woesearchaeota archaeon]